MRLTPRLGLRLVLVLVLLSLLWLRLVPRLMHHGSARNGNDLAVTRPLNQPGGGPAPAEAYPVYSALYQTPSDEPLAFAAASQTDIPQVGTSCLKPTTPDERQLADAFQAANTQSHSWQPQFTIPQGYRVLTPSETAQARACLQAHDRTSSACAPYSQARHVRFLGVPGFDATHTHALVSVIKSCGGFCGSGGVFEVEKSGDTWKRLPTTDFTRDCSWAY
ncbi:MAG TPA: hypothetical protein VME68_10435 [Acidobacteriaceae bacterium]|nr:hypothetical protein [Acidobacteriaceae bacterium]